MNYFNGFALKGEELLFDDYLGNGDFTIGGFSFGAQKAFEFCCHTDRRIEKLILLSPAFFQNMPRSFVRTQLRYFSSDKEGYIERFLSNAAYPSSLDLHPFFAEYTYEELDALLTYRWDHNKILELLDRGTKIEVYLGGRDKIIQSQEAFDFFSALTTTYLIKKAGHILRSWA